MTVLKFRARNRNYNHKSKDLAIKLSDAINEYNTHHALISDEVVEVLCNLISSIDLQHMVDEDCNVPHYLLLLKKNIDDMIVMIHKNVAEFREGDAA